MSQTTQAQPSFARTFLGPALWVLLLPVVGFVFTRFELWSWTESWRDSLRRSAAQDPTAPSGEALEATLGELDVGSAAIESCGSFGFFSSPEGVGDGLCSDVLQFVWVERISLALILLAAAIFVALAVSVVRASREPKALLPTLRLGWNTLRAFSIPHVVGQGIIVVFLSFWVTAIMFEVYFVKLIIIAALLAIAAMATAFKALFAKTDFVPVEHGQVLGEEDAPSLFAHIRSLASEVGTDVPRQVVVGIDDNFFVTETPMDVIDRFPTADNPTHNVRRVEGRTLYTSIPLLRALSRDEGDAVLAHELAHFARGDTRRSVELNPLLWRFDAYLETLATTITFGVGSCLLAFRAFFERVARLHGRAAEFDADATAARVTSEAAFGNALWKIGAYATYRGVIEDDLFSSMDKDQALGISDRVSQGFQSFVADGEQGKLLDSLLDVGTPHPFDTHPALVDRLDRLGLPPPSRDAAITLTERPAKTLCDEIPGADEAEQGLWAAYEERFQENHERSIAIHLMPTTDEEIAIVERHFPTVTLESKAGPYVLSWRHFQLADGTTIPWGDVDGAEAKDLMIGKGLIVKTKDGGKHTIKLNGFSDKGEALLGAFNTLWNRHHAAVAEEERARLAAED